MGSGKAQPGIFSDAAGSAASSFPLKRFSGNVSAEASGFFQRPRDPFR